MAVSTAVGLIIPAQVMLMAGAGPAFHLIMTRTPFPLDVTREIIMAVTTVEIWGAMVAMVAMVVAAMEGAMEVTEVTEVTEGVTEETEEEMDVSQGTVWCKCLINPSNQ
jgi:adenosine/AMP kinase